MPLYGFGNHHQSEAIPGALPTYQNSPQKCPLGLYAEQVNASAFTRPRHANLKSWLYRTLPSAVVQNYSRYQRQAFIEYDTPPSPNPMRWSPLPTPKTALDFVDGLFPLAGNELNQAYLYQASRSMTTRYFSNRDGEMLFVPYHGEAVLFTEFGSLKLLPGHMVVIPRGIYFKVELLSPMACGYVCENGGMPFALPQLGPIGANGLANPRHFIYPDAQFESHDASRTLICKYQHTLWKTTTEHSPLNVVAWAGNAAPYAYDLSLFNTINTVSYDHPDPSIFTVLTSESEISGMANLDFVIFPSRWMVAEHTFRPPYYHRNVMSEFMGLVYGQYDAKGEGFVQGGVSIHNRYTPHGPDAKTYGHASETPLIPMKYDNTLAIMFECKDPWHVTKHAMAHACRQKNYSQCWEDLKKASFSPATA